MEGLIIGKVLWFNKAKGYGELYGEDEKTYFFTYKELKSRDKFKSIDKEAYVYFSPTNETHLGQPVAGLVREATKKKATSLRSRFGNLEV